MQGAENVLVGVAGSGKTSSLAMALGEDPSGMRVSTPCAKVPVRTVAHTRIGIDGKSKEEKLQKTEDKKYFSTITDTLMEIARTLPDITHNPTHPGHPLSPPLPDVRKDIPNYMRKLEEEMIRHVHCETRVESLLHQLCWNRLTDSGGQPQFLEMLSIFIHHISLAIFTIKLNERLDHRPDIEYYNKEGNPWS